MFLALRELRFARSRFGLMGGVIALISVLMVLLSGLSSGLVEDGVSGLKATPVDGFAFNEGTKTDSAFSRSVVTDTQVQAWREQPGVAEAQPFGNMLVNAHNDKDVPVDLALFGVPVDSFLAPAVADGTTLGEPNGIVIGRSALDTGVELGDTVTVDRLGTELKIVGVTDDKRTFGHVDVAYLPIDTWRELHAGVRPGETVPAQALTESTAVALKAQPGVKLDYTAGDAAARTSTVSLEDSFAASPGFSAETMTLDLIKVFLYAISALVVGAFFTVWTIQRKHEIAVMRAMGASTGYLLRDGLAQALILLLGSVTVGAAVGYGFGSLIGGGVPFLLEPAAVAVAAVLLIVLGLIGAAVAIVRIASVNPLNALGGQR
ncbi:ABC transporter permease [Rhodococcus sp. SGAir0479]|uniref:ABC transporter permease n=1 Tax=Rhodococcus sp. SGAir0479 TaxID=2567884 RepID=UPI0010CCB619|nr:ABC transporter permease [Rhodococcus sp. SGAir0479]QCQ93052.1 ABC transporter permease [Rhodococcus sp. SGAir0479]